MVLAGGRGARLGGRDKGEIRIDGRRLIDIVVDAALAVDCERVIVAGETVSTSATNVVERPRFGGPVAGLAAALPETGSEWILLLACDLPQAADLCRLIDDAAGQTGPQGDGLIVSAAGRSQWLAGLYRRTAIEARLDRLDEPSDASLREVLGDLELQEAEDPAGWSRDIDTPDDLAAVCGQ